MEEAQSGIDAQGRWRTVDEIANEFGVSSRQVYNWLSEGAPSIRIGTRSRRIGIEALEQWLRERYAA